MIRLGLRLAVGGGREALARLVILTAAVAIGTGLLLTALSGINAVNAQNDRYSWMDTAAVAQGLTIIGPGPGGAIPQQASPPAATGSDPLWGRITTDVYRGQRIVRADVAATGPASPVPPGIPRLPAAGQYYASPALSALMRATPADELAARYPGHQVGTIGPAALPSPDSLVIVIGRSAAQLARLPGAAQVTSFNSVAPDRCGGACVVREGINNQGIDLVLSVVALALLLPVAIFIATATRLSAARREQRFAAMRLTGATPQQVSAIAAVESVLAAAAGVAAGFGLFFLMRVPLAAIPFTGQPFYPDELSLSLPEIVAVAAGVPAVAAAAARLALRRVNISPLGVSRRVTPRPPRPWGLLLLLAGLAELGFFLVHGRPPTASQQIWAFLPAFALIMTGLVAAGPWLTLTGARVMAWRARRPAALIAARRLADDPRAGFRAVSGLALALFITTVAVALITSQNTKNSGLTENTTASNILVDQFVAQVELGKGVAPPVQPTVPVPPATLLARLRQIRGVTGIVELHADPGQVIPPSLGARMGIPQGFPAGVASCAQIPSIPWFGPCANGATAVLMPVFLATPDFPGPRPVKVTWPAASVSPGQLASLPLDSIAVGTNGSPVAIEQARTLLERAFPAGQESPATLGDEIDRRNVVNQAYQQLADVVILVSLVIAGCTLAASVAAGLADRKRPFSLLRLTGARLSMLRRVVTLESAVPLLAVAVLAIGIGFAAAAMYAPTEMQVDLVAPDPGYYILTGAGIVVALGIIVGMFPLLRRITGPESARND